MKALDIFFGNVMGDLDNLTITPLSNCCSAPALGEVFRSFGRCSDCLEMAEFSASGESITGCYR